MLAQNFMSAADLKLPGAEYQALITTLGMMERGEIRYVDVDIHDLVDDEVGAFSGLFNLAQWAGNFSCGTVACIGGTAELVGNLKPNQINNRCEYMKELDELCYPKGEINYENVTVEQAAKALRSYLTTGKANWTEALA